jgi:hypothetical protein
MEQLPDANYVRDKLHRVKPPTGKDKLKLCYDRHMQYVNWTSGKYDVGTKEIAKIEFLECDKHMLEHYDYEYIFKFYERCSLVFKKYMEIIDLVIKGYGRYDFECHEKQDDLYILLEDNGFKVDIVEEYIFISLP